MRSADQTNDNSDKAVAAKDPGPGDPVSGLALRLAAARILREHHVWEALRVLPALAEFRNDGDRFARFRALMESGSLIEAIQFLGTAARPEWRLIDFFRSGETWICRLERGEAGRAVSGWLATARHRDPAAALLAAVVASEQHTKTTDQDMPEHSMPTFLRSYLPEGAICDLVTPFRDGEVDRVGLMTLIDWQIRSGISGLVVCGEASEAATLSHEERAAVIGLAVDVVDHQVPLLAGTGTNSTETTIDLTRQARDLGADAALVITPYYNIPSQEGLFRHFERLAAAVDIPIIVCNAPGRTAVDLATRTLERLASIPSIVGVIDCTGDMARFAGLPPALRDRFRHLSGHDATTCPFFLCGGSGSISTGANVAPRLFAAMHHALRTGNVDAAYALQARLNPLLQAMEKEGTPAAIKHALSLVLPLSPEVRLPITAAALGTQAEIRMALSSLPECGERHRRTG